MTSSLVGSEMCIRDSILLWRIREVPSFMSCQHGLKSPTIHAWFGLIAICCLLYTSDAADDM
eukprot:10904557-Prorocentrum_lima.AAC.1